MRVVFLVLGLALVLGSAADAGGRAKETQEEREACATPRKPVEGDGLERPHAVHRAIVSPSDLKRWGPIEVSAVIDCKGRLTSIELNDRVPPEVSKRMIRRLEKWRFEPARFEDKPVAVEYHLTLARRDR